MSDDHTLKPIPRHFKKHHDCNASVLKKKGIDNLNLDGRGGNLKQKLAQLEAWWIIKIYCLQPKGLSLDFQCSGLFYFILF